MPSRPGRAGASGLRWLWLSAAVVLLDQATKVLALSALAPYQPVPVLPFLNLTLGFNPGAAFSLLADAGGWQRWLFVAAALGVGGFLAYWLRSLESRQVGLCLSLALLLGGAVGNLYDRVFRHGLVVDFLDVHYRGWHWPAFNVADAAICIGAVLLIVASLREPASPT